MTPLTDDQVMAALHEAGPIGEDVMVTDLFSRMTRKAQVLSITELWSRLDKLVQQGRAVTETKLDDGKWKRFVRLGQKEIGMRPDVDVMERIVANVVDERLF